jgi:hypothetical protein
MRRRFVSFFVFACISICEYDYNELTHQLPRISLSMKQASVTSMASLPEEEAVSFCGCLAICVCGGGVIQRPDLFYMVRHIYRLLGGGEYFYGTSNACLYHPAFAPVALQTSIGVNSACANDA